MNETVQQQFETTSTEQLQAALDATDGRAEVTDIWIYTTSWGGFLTSFVVYKTEGHPPVRDYYLDSVLTTPVGSTTEEWQDILGDAVADASFALFEAYRDAGEEHPTRIVVHYDVHGQKMDASFTYDKLDAEILDSVPLFEKWLAHGQQTGDLTADALTIPGE